MAESAVRPTSDHTSTFGPAHSGWVRICHWTVAASFFVLAFSGFTILMAHPRLYWGQVGNDLTPALLELPISDNHRPEGWQQTVSFGELADASASAPADAPISADRTYEIFNQNGWARSLHFLAGWFLVVAGAIYTAAGLVTGHIRRDVLPAPRALASRAPWRGLKQHLRLAPRADPGASRYGLLQRCAYAGAAFVALPFMVVTGLSMSPAVTAAYPILMDMFGGHQSARTLHFFGFAALVLFLIVHVAMVILTGFRRQLRAMIFGS